MEFIVLGLPVVSLDTCVDRYPFDEPELRFLRSGDEAHTLADDVRRLAAQRINSSLREVSTPRARIGKSRRKPSPR